jgi:hypothetical protein
MSRQVYEPSASEGEIKKFDGQRDGSFFVWERAVKLELFAKECAHVLEEPEEEEESDDEDEERKREKKASLKEFKRCDGKAKGLIGKYLSDSQKSRMDLSWTAKEIWEDLHQTFAETDPASRLALQKEFNQLKFQGESSLDAHRQVQGSGSPDACCANWTDR